MKIVVISDCHIGNHEANVKQLNKFLVDLNCEWLIIAGDFWEMWEKDSNYLKEKFDNIINTLKLVKENGIRISYLLGNHDENYLKDPVMNFSDLPVIDSLHFESGNKNIAIIHGQQYDWMFIKFHFIYRFLYWIKTKLLRIVNYKKRSLSDYQEHSGYINSVSKMYTRARKDYKKYGYDVLIMGHTHVPIHLKGGDFFIEFVNSGDWKRNNTFVEIENGEISLIRWDDGQVM